MQLTRRKVELKLPRVFTCPPGAAPLSKFLRAAERALRRPSSKSAVGAVQRPISSGRGRPVASEIV
jgi:hypothetical protein